MTTRRAFLFALGTAGTVGLAGCSGPQQTTPSGTARPKLNEEFSFDGYLTSASSFDGEVVDAHGQAEASVAVGAAGNGGYRAFGPPAVSVDPGTTLVWEWTGRGGAHNVVHEDGEFRSELVVEEGHTFERTFEGAGVYKYYCAPHLRNGMKGVVRVGDRPE
jgi:halocyanin-like protein